jgi:hypothetical protein
MKGIAIFSGRTKFRRRENSRSETSSHGVPPKEGEGPPPAGYQSLVGSPPRRGSVVFYSTEEHMASESSGNGSRSLKVDSWLVGDVAWERSGFGDFFFDNQYHIYS